MQNIEQLLMRNLMRACASAKRHPRGLSSEPGHDHQREHTGGPEHSHGHEHGRGHGHRSGHRGSGHILALLSETSGISQQQIADTLGIRPQSASEAIATLEQQGFIKKESSPTDRRMTLIHITDAGRIRADELATEHKARAEKLFSVLSQEEKETLLMLLMKLTETKEDA